MIMLGSTPSISFAILRSNRHANEERRSALVFG